MSDVVAKPPMFSIASMKLLLNWLITPQGLQCVIHALIAGWIVYWFGWVFVLILALVREAYDLYDRKDYQDHFYDLASWMIGVVVWVIFATIAGDLDAGILL